MKPKVLVFSGYGINCEGETKFAFDAAGGDATIMHINDIISNKSILQKYQILAFPGGFAYGDDTGAGNAYAQKLKNHLWKELLQFVKKDKLILGICNGFQILVNVGLLPDLGLMPNEIPRYTVRFVDLQVENHTSPWLKNMTTLSIPVSNGEGKLYAEKDVLEKMKTKSAVMINILGERNGTAEKDVLEKMKKNNQIAFQYTKGSMCAYLNLPASPNGSIENIAGVLDESGKILGVMPHPERAMFFTQLPNWQLLKEKYVRANKKIPHEAPGIQLFKNAIQYFNE